MTYIIYENQELIVWFCQIDSEIHITHIDKSKTASFEEFVRIIDTIPDKSPEWKKDIIDTWAENVGFKGVA
ncbi:MAG: hypothetical protein II234_00075 [Clostridia bacterium]|nr:hypothetical protein [Clostridia bacterium]MBQ5900476.1 hypothetical protein [Clostridia bacterium]